MNDDIVETGDICTCSRYVSAQMRMIKYFYNDSSPNAEFALSRIPPDHSFGETLLKNKRFLLQFWPHQNLLYLIYIYENPKVPFSFCATLYVFLMNALVYIDIDQGIH